MIWLLFIFLYLLGMYVFHQFERAMQDAFPVSRGIFEPEIASPIFLALFWPLYTPIYLISYIIQLIKEVKSNSVSSFLPKFFKTIQRGFLYRFFYRKMK